MLTENPENIIKSAAKNWSIEITPNAAKKVGNFSKILKPKTTVNVTFLPNTNLLETIELSTRLFDDGMFPVPHISTMALKNKDGLKNIPPPIPTTPDIRPNIYPTKIDNIIGVFFNFI